jgi:hypothetical protein
MNEEWQVVEVEARFDRQGHVTPLSMNFEGRRLGLSCGRSWQDAQGRHILVMGPEDHVMELLFVPGDMIWYWKKSLSERHVVV